MFEHELRLLLDRQAPAGGGALGLSAFAAPLLLPPGLAPPTHRRPHPPHGVQDQLVDILDHVHRANAIGTLRTTIVIPFRSSTRRFIPHLSNRSWPDAESTGHRDPEGGHTDAPATPSAPTPGMGHPLHLRPPS